MDAEPGKRKARDGVYEYETSAGTRFYFKYRQVRRA